MAVNLAPNPTFGANVAGWGTTQGSVAQVGTAGQDGNGFLRFTSSVTGNANFQQSPPIPCVPGEVFSVEAYIKHAAGTPRSGFVMVQFLNGSLVQTGNFLSAGVLATGAWQVLSSINAIAPAGTTQVRVQGRIGSGVSGDAMDFDNIYLNAGSTVQRAAAPSGGAFSWWDGTNEVPASLTFWDGTNEVPVTAAIEGA